MASRVSHESGPDHGSAATPLDLNRLPNRRELVRVLPVVTLVEARRIAHADSFRLGSASRLRSAR
jgi:hypothetical protein